MSFEESLQVGLLGEQVIAQWLIRKGYQVLPAYEIELIHGKGPRLFTTEGPIITPDLLVFNGQKIVWCEAKTKTAFTWHRLSGTWQTGIDRKHWLEYLRIAQLTPFPVWIFFLHKPNGQAKDTPEGMMSPSGLFGHSIEQLNRSIHHEHANHGPSGMVYWTVDALKSVCSWELLNRTN